MTAEAEAAIGIEVGIGIEMTGVVFAAGAGAGVAAEVAGENTIAQPHPMQRSRYRGVAPIDGATGPCAASYSVVAAAAGVGR